MLYVVATLDLQPGARSAFLAEFEQLAPQVRAEQGCMEYVPTVDAPAGVAAQRQPDPDRVTIVERWESLAALEAHDRAPHMQAFRARVKAYVRARQIVVLTPA